MRKTAYLIVYLP